MTERSEGEELAPTLDAREEVNRIDQANEVADVISSALWSYRESDNAGKYWIYAAADELYKLGYRKVES